LGGQQAPDGQFGRSELPSSFLPWCLPPSILFRKTRRKKATSAIALDPRQKYLLSCVRVRPPTLECFPQAHSWTLPRVCIYLASAKPCDLSFYLAFDGLVSFRWEGEKKKRKEKLFSKCCHSISCDVTRSPKETLHVRETSCTFPLFPRYMTNQPCQLPEYPASSPQRGKEKEKKREKNPQRSGPAREDHVPLFWCEVWEEGGLGRVVFEGFIEKAM